jgi:hypothetical protein
MFGFSAKLPVNEDELQWIDEAFDRLKRMLGAQPMSEAHVVLPTAEHFPDPYDRTRASVEMLLERVCGYMQVDRSTIELEVLTDKTRELKDLLPTGAAAREVAPVCIPMTGVVYRAKTRQGW